jgi:predicted RNA methylase
VEDSVGSAYIPKLLGIYENELAAQVEEICRRKPGLIVDIGAAEGYYAIGLAVRNPQAKVIAFEMEPKGQAALREMSTLNEVSNRVEVRGKCEPSDLAATLENTGEPVVICDVEGYEEKLLDPQAVPALAKAAILVELHDFIIPGITKELQQRFATTHRIEHIWQQPRSRSQFPWRTFGTMLLPKSYLDWSVSEWRPTRMAWLWMEPHG